MIGGLKKYKGLHKEKIKQEKLLIHKTGNNHGEYLEKI